MKCLNQIKKYVPRHFRLGTCASSPVIHHFHDVLEDVPVVDDNGSVVETHHSLKSVPASEDMQKYRASQFQLSALVKAGVPLKLVNINCSRTATIEQLYNVCKSVDDASNVVARFEADMKERRSWFTEPEPSEPSKI